MSLANDASGNPLYCVATVAWNAELFRPQCEILVPAMLSGTF